MNTEFYIIILIFSMSLVSLTFAIILWVTRPKTNKSLKKQLKKTKKIAKEEKYDEIQKN